MADDLGHEPGHLADDPQLAPVSISAEVLVDGELVAAEGGDARAEQPGSYNFV